MANSPRGRVQNWKQVLKEIKRLREKNLYSLEGACTKVGISYSSYHVWKRKLNSKEKKKLLVSKKVKS